MNTYPDQGVHNFRDLGGYIGIDGRRLIRQRLFRSGQLTHASDTDVENLRKLNIGLVVDLRSDHEYLHAPRLADSLLPVTYIRIETKREEPPHNSLTDALSSADAMRRSMLSTYETMPFRRNILLAAKAYFQSLGQLQNQASVIHCFAGKDRTGLLVALLQKALGMQDDDVLEDYLLTNTWGDPSVRIESGRQALMDWGKLEISDDALVELMSVRDEYLAQAFSAIQEQYGSTERYLEEAVGIDATDLEKLKMNCLQD